MRSLFIAFLVFVAVACSAATTSTATQKSQTGTASTKTQTISSDANASANSPATATVAPAVTALPTTPPTPLATREPTPTPTPKPPTPTPNPKPPTPTPKPPTPTPTPSGPPVAFKDGTLRVGQNIQPGTYTTVSQIKSCYWERLRGFTGSFDEIIANDNPEGVGIVTIAPTDAGFKSVGCGGWASLDGIPPREDPNAQFGPGEYVVKAQVAPGTWQSSGSGNCYWERLKGFSGEFGDILANDNVTAPTIVTIKPTDVGFKATKGCGNWTKVG